ncbi:MAG: tRNA 2-thiocytidine biosynthesis TtcA family protein [Lachnospiraceae bacterium]|nr:tRNA 2-thiocytidine biosynthesis TtcA family protein [Lachnospiraceae bacterium]
MTLRRLLSLTRKAVDEYNMIEENDRIAIGISGGKDSLTLLYALSGLRRFYPKKFDIEAITVDLGFEGFNVDNITELCKELDVNYTVIHTQIKDVVFDIRKETNPCSLCAKMRKGALNDKIKELNCNKSAFAHHRDDIIETALMSLIYEGHFYCFAPVTYLDRTEITLIRPLLYVKEADIKGFCNKMELPILKNPCPVDGNTKREYVKLLANKLESENNGFKDRMFHAVKAGVATYQNVLDHERNAAHDED